MEKLTTQVKILHLTLKWLVKKMGQLRNKV